MSSGSDEEITLQDAIVFYREGLASGELTSHDRLAYLVNLGNALSELAEEECDIELASEAIIAGCEALKGADHTSSTWLGISSDLSASYLTRFELTGNKDDLDHALTMIRTATDSTTKGSGKRCARLANLCNTLCVAFEAYGNRGHIDEAIAIGRIASEDERGGANDRARALANLGKALGLRYDAFQAFSDVLKAVDADELAVSIAEEPSIKAICKSNLVGHLVSVAERDCTDGTVERAIELGRSISDGPPGPHKARCAHNLSYLFRLRFERVNKVGPAQFGDPQDLQSAVDYATEAINSYPGEDVQLAMYEDQLVLCLQLAYDRSPLDADKLQLAIVIAQNAVSRTKEQDPRKATYTNHLVELLRRRCEAGDIERAASLSESALNSESAELISRIAAGQASGLNYHQLGDLPGAYRCFNQAVELVLRAALNALQRSDQQYVLGQCVGLSSMAASIALENGQTPAEAFKVLEKGRAILTELVIRSRTGLSPQVESCPGVQPFLERYKELKQILNPSPQPQSGTDFNSRLSDDVWVTLRSQLRVELVELEAQIEDIMQRELKSTSVLLQPATLLGTDFIVAFNVTAIRSDAFIMTTKGIQAIALPKLTAQNLTDQVRSLLGPQRITRIKLDTWRNSNEKLTAVLLWLWDCAVEPVLSHLNILRESTDENSLPRVCWIASGAMGLMPFHAAGDHTGSSNSFTMAHVVSSYAISALSLEWCRQELHSRIAAATLTDYEAIAITMAKTPGRPDLDCAAELAAFFRVFPMAQEIPNPTPSLACERIKASAIIHCACHAESDPEDPSNSSLSLSNKEGHTIDRLSVYTLAESDSPRAMLAFLSACQTADQQKLDHIDETIHLAGAFQIAGFPQVVGSLWEAENDYSSQLAVAFYQGFAEAGGYSAGTDTAVLAMHHALMQLRSEDPEAVLSWAPFVIYGA